MTRNISYLFLTFIIGISSVLIIVILNSSVIILFLSFFMITTIFFLGKKEKVFDILEPFVLIFFVYIFTFIIPGFFSLQSKESEMERYVVIAVLYVTLSFFFFFVGYRSDIGRRLSLNLPRFKADWSRQKLLILIVIYSVIGIGGYFIAMDKVGGVDNYVSNIGKRIELTAGYGYFFQSRNFVIVANFLWFIDLITKRIIYEKRPRKIEIIFYLLHLFLILGMVGILGSRGTILQIFLCMMIARHYLVKRITVKTFAGFLIVATLFIYLYGEFRKFSVYEYTRYDYAELKQMVSAEEKIYRFLSSGLADGANVVANIVCNVPSILDIQWGKTYWNVIYYPIPRSMFAAKPKTGGQILTEALYPNEVNTYLSPNMIGEAYLNFHVIGVIAVSWMFGIFARTLYAYLRTNYGNKSVVAVCSIFLINTYLFPINEFINVVLEFPKIGITLLALLLIKIRS